MEARIKLTKTMLDKHIIDANNSVREFVKNVGVVFDDMSLRNKNLLPMIWLQ